MQKTNVQSGARLPSLPVGNSDWAAVKAGYWSADKTQLISGFLDKKSTVAVFMRPRRFGKNREEGDGRPDILMKPRPGVTLPGVVLELKSPKIPARASQKRIDALLTATAKQARKQIDEKRYAAEMEVAGIAVLKYGIGFSGKRVELAK